MERRTMTGHPRELSRRAVMGAASAGLWAVAGGARAAAPPLEWAWPRYLSRFMQPDGRIVDTGNAGISHSEGQGFTMILAVAMRDRRAFEAAWHWADTTLRVRDDALMAWRYDPAAATPVADLNNATDGDLMAAWALLRASGRWAVPEWRAEAGRIVRDLMARCIVNHPLGPILLPGAHGFERAADQTVVLNPSYWIFPAMTALSPLASDRDTWLGLRVTGLHVLSNLTRGPWRLPPDWVALNARNELSPAEGFAFRFGYEAIRIPIYTVWNGIRSPDLLRPFADWARVHGGHPPATIDLHTQQVAEYTASTGARAALALARRATGEAAAIPAPTDADDYYSSVLSLMSLVAATEGGVI
jgi:endoglucanase